MPPASSAEREEERRLNTRTLTIASVASASAAAVTSQLWIAGTWIAAALTPVLVALISEAMHRPTERIARAWTSEREPRGPGRRAQTATRGEPAAVTGSAGPVRVYRQTTRGTTESTRGRPVLSGRRIPMRAVVVTAALAFAIGIAILTTVDLVSGGSVGRGSGRTTAFGGGSASEPEKQSKDATPTRQDAPEEQGTAPSEPPPTTPTTPSTSPTTGTTPETPPEAPPGEPVPNSTP